MSNKNTTEEASNDNSLVSGSAWMTAGSMISRIIGALYIIPWIQWMGGGELGAAANGLFQMAYTPYGFFLALATAGVPSAISKQVSYYNTIGEYEVSKSIYKQGLKIMALTGIGSAVIMFILAPDLAGTSPAATPSDAALVIRSLTPALLIIPLQAVTRGFIQGHSRMTESAISQIVEQIVRVIFLLASTYLIMQVLDGDVVTAVSFSTFAAFVGAIASFGFLLIRLRQLPTAINRAPEESRDKISVSTNQILIEIIRTSIPFIIVSTGVTVFTLIDQVSYAPLMSWLHGMSEGNIQITYGIVQGNAHKLTMILTSFGSALAVTSVPIISKLVAKRDIKGVSKQFSKALQLIFLIMFPAVIGVIIVAEPLYTIFFGGYNALGVSVTRVYAVVSIIISLYIILGNSLQAANLKKKAVGALLVGLVVKIVTQPFAIYFFAVHGMLVSNFIGLGTSCFIMLRVAYKHFNFSLEFIIRRTLLIFLMSAVMGLGAFITKLILGNFLDFRSSFEGLIGMLVVAAVGVIIYLILILKTRIADKLIGNVKAGKVRKMIKMS